MSSESEAFKAIYASLQALSKTVRMVHLDEGDQPSTVPATQLRTILTCTWLSALTRESYNYPFRCFSEPHAGLSSHFDHVVEGLPITVRKGLPLYVSHSNEPMFHEIWTTHVRHVSPIRLVREGYETNVAETLSSILDVRPLDLLTTLGISGRTVSRRLTEHKKLTQEESDRLYRALDITRTAVEVFGDSDLAGQWLTEPNPSLEGQAPLSLLDTEPGKDKVMSLLGQIDHGVYA